MRECRPCHLIRDMVHLGRIGFEEFQACGDIVKEVVDGHVGAGGTSALLHRPENTALNVHLRSFKRVSRASEEFKLGHGGDTCESLPAEPKGVNTLKVFHTIHFARCVAF